MKKNLSQTLNYIMIIAIGLLSNACYTIIDVPSDEQSHQHSMDSSTSSDVVESSDNNQDYTIINNYDCNHSSNCCGHNHCHSYSHHHGYSCSGYCQITFNWWTGTYHWNHYHHHYGHHDYGYYHGYHDGYYDGYWWGYNNWDSDDYDYSGDYADNTQDRRERSFTRDNSVTYTSNSIEHLTNDISDEEPPLDSPTAQITSDEDKNSKKNIDKDQKINYQRINTHSKGSDIIESKNRRSKSYRENLSIGSQKISGRKKTDQSFSKSSNSIIDFIGIISSISSSGKSKKKSKLASTNSKKSKKKSKKKQSFKARK